MAKANGVRQSTGYTALELRKSLDYTRANNADITDRLSSEDEDEGEQDASVPSEEGRAPSPATATAPAAAGGRIKGSNRSSAVGTAAKKLASAVSSAVSSVVPNGSSKKNSGSKIGASTDASTSPTSTAKKVNGRLKGKNNGVSTATTHMNGANMNDPPYAPVASTSQLTPTTAAEVSTATGGTKPTRKRGRPSKAEAEARKMRESAASAAAAQGIQLNGQHQVDLVQPAVIVSVKRTLHEREAGASSQPATSTRSKRQRFSQQDQHHQQRRRMTSTPDVQIQDSLFTSQASRRKKADGMKSVAQNGTEEDGEDEIESGENNGSQDDRSSDGDHDTDERQEPLFRSASVESKSLSPPPPSQRKASGSQSQHQPVLTGPSPTARRSGLTVKKLKEVEALQRANERQAKRDKDAEKSQKQQSPQKDRHKQQSKASPKKVVRRSPTPATDADELREEEDESETANVENADHLEMDLDPASSSSAEEAEVTKSLIAQELPSRSPKKKKTVTRQSVVAKGKRRASDPTPATASRSQGKGKGKARDVTDVSEAAAQAKGKGTKRYSMPARISQSNGAGPSGTQSSSSAATAPTRGAKAARKTSRPANGKAGPSKSSAKLVASSSAASGSGEEDDGDDDEDEDEDEDNDSDEDESNSASAPDATSRPRAARHAWIRQRLSRITAQEHRALLAHRERDASRVRGNAWKEDEEITLILALNDMFADVPTVGGHLTAADVNQLTSKRWIKLQELHGKRGTLSNILKSRTNVNLKDKARNIQKYREEKGLSSFPWFTAPREAPQSDEET